MKFYYNDVEIEKFDDLSHLEKMERILPIAIKDSTTKNNEFIANNKSFKTAIKFVENNLQP